MRIKFNKEIEFLFKKLFISEKYLLRKRLERAIKKNYEEELELLDKIVSKDLENDESIGGQLIWARDVLTKYFSVVENNTIVSKCRNQFEKIDIAFGSKGKKIPFNQLSKEPPFQYDHFFKLTKNRRSVRWYLPKPVPREMIDRAILAAVQSPSSCNRLPYEFRVIDDEKMVKEVSTIPMGTKGFADNIPVIIAVVGHLDE